MKQVNVGIIGTGWCGGIRAVACSKNPLVRELHIAEVNPERLIEMTGMVRAPSGENPSPTTGDGVTPSPWL